MVLAACQEEAEFFANMIGLIGVVQPKPIEAYKFTPKSKIDIMRSIKSARAYEKYAQDLDQQLKKIKVEKQLKGVEKLATKGSKEYFEDRLVGHVFKDEGRSWVVTDVEYEHGLKTYVVGYKPQRLTKRSSDQDREGYETQLTEWFEIIGKKAAGKLGLKSNYAWYQENQ